jgi:hypothetical protein
MLIRPVRGFGKITAKETVIPAVEDANTDAGVSDAAAARLVSLGQKFMTKG